MEKRRILLVEDDEKTRELVAKNLRMEGYEVLGVATGEAGLKLAGTIEPDLVLLDLLLPGIDGWDVLAKLRNNPQTSYLPVIILTALTEVKHKVHGLRGGADDYVPKPFSTSELMARVEAVLKRSTQADKERFLDQLPGRKGDKIHLIIMDEVNYIDVERDSTYIHTDDDNYTLNYALAELENSLDPHNFFRAHRGFIVNLNKVKEIGRGSGSSFELTLSDRARTRIPLSRRRASTLKKMLGI